MSYASLREFLGAVEGIGELKTIRNADWNLEIGALTEWYAAQQKNPCLLFDRIVGYPEGYRVCTLYLASPNRTALALGLPVIPTCRKAASSKLVSTVTARSFGRRFCDPAPASALAAARIIWRPPVACTFSSRTPGRLAAAAMAPTTVLGIS